MMKKRNYLLFISLLLLCSLVISACGKGENSSSNESTNSNQEVNHTEGSTTGSEQGALKENLIMATHPQGSAYNSTGAGVAKVVTANSPMQVTVKPHAGPNAWMPLLNWGEIDMGIISSPDVAWGIMGDYGYTEKNNNVRMLVIGNYPPTNGLVVRSDSGITKTSDLKGKRVAAGYAGNQLVDVITTLHLETVGLTWDDVEAVPVTSTTTGLEALQDGRVDAAMGVSPVTAKLLEVASAVGGLTALNFGDIAPENFDQFPEEMRSKIAEQIPGTRPAVYENVGILEGTSATIIEYPVLIASSTHLSEETAYEIVKTLYENYEELHPIFTWLQDWSDESMFEESPPVPYHEGAIRYFKERGIWTDEAEENQQELLKMAE